MGYVAIASTQPRPDEIQHYGRLGQKWYQHVYGEVDGRAAYARKGLNKIASLNERSDKAKSKQLGKDKAAVKADTKATKLEQKEARLERKAAKEDRKANSRFRSQTSKDKHLAKADKYYNRATKVAAKAAVARTTANDLLNDARKNKYFYILIKIVKKK